MIEYCFGTDLWLKPSLAETMFRDRAVQFSKRLEWPVQVDAQGFERDQYDALNPIYIVAVKKDGTHEGSLRLLPMTGRTMISEHFKSAIQGYTLTNQGTWECTRFCLSPSASSKTTATLLTGVGHLMRELDIRSVVAVFDKVMLRVYRASGVAPEVLGQTQISGTTVMAGRWHFDVNQLDCLMHRSSLDPMECDLAFINSSLTNFSNFKNW